MTALRDGIGIRSAVQITEHLLAPRRGGAGPVRPGGSHLVLPFAPFRRRRARIRPVDLPGAILRLKTPPAPVATSLGSDDRRGCVAISVLPSTPRRRFACLPASASWHPLLEPRRPPCHVRPAVRPVRPPFCPCPAPVRTWFSPAPPRRCPPASHPAGLPSGRGPHSVAPLPRRTCSPVSGTDSSTPPLAHPARRSPSCHLWQERARSSDELRTQPHRPDHVKAHRKLSASAPRRTRRAPRAQSRQAQAHGRLRRGIPAPARLTAHRPTSLSALSPAALPPCRLSVQSSRPRAPAPPARLHQPLRAAARRVRDAPRTAHA